VTNEDMGNENDMTQPSVFVQIRKNRGVWVEHRRTTPVKQHSILYRRQPAILPSLFSLVNFFEWAANMVLCATLV
jgi:hypothetical protein